MPQGVLRAESNGSIGKHPFALGRNFRRLGIVEKCNERFDRRIANRGQRSTRLFTQNSVLQQHDQIRNDAWIAELTKSRGRCFFDERILADDAARRRRAILPDPFPFQGIQHGSQRPWVTDHAERRDGMALDRTVLHGFDQSIDGTRISDHAQRDRRIFADGAIRVFQRGNERINNFRLTHPCPAYLVVGRHPAEGPCGMAAHDKIFVLETFDQRIH